MSKVLRPESHQPRRTFSGHCVAERGTCCRLRRPAYAQIAVPAQSPQCCWEGLCGVCGARTVQMPTRRRPPAATTEST
ncbi:hypothetical protein L226DRAFT_232490 [Lentinus tigrinus ALCF2SS1-7]|uniref:uncharacterized protein n=1 Tax=Lentinus tigrinus ALCF2SS1-7 TaxID=1328758 RepID=UPI001165F64C|nr:hypothetical protein L226DRAFT_232490 [Lentinus tigrinus ALCF2SS1-7]